MYRARMKAMVQSSTKTIAPAIAVAIQKAFGHESGTRYGTAWPRPPSAVIIPVIAPIGVGALGETGDELRNTSERAAYQLGVGRG